MTLGGLLLSETMVTEPHGCQDPVLFIITQLRFLQQQFLLFPSSLCNFKVVAGCHISDSNNFYICILQHFGSGWGVEGGKQILYKLYSALQRKHTILLVRDTEPPNPAFKCHYFTADKLTNALREYVSARLYVWFSHGDLIRQFAA